MNNPLLADDRATLVVKTITIIEIILVLTIAILIASSLYSQAFVLGFFNVAMIAILILWLWNRYQHLPSVINKKNLLESQGKTTNEIDQRIKIIKRTQVHREQLKDNEKKELSATLKELQNRHIENGLRSFKVEDAKISGVGPKLKGTLAAYRIITAADVSGRIDNVPGFGPAKVQNLLEWKQQIYSKYNQTKPGALPQETSDEIKNKYLELQKLNDAEENTAKTEQTGFENQLAQIETHLEPLLPLSYPKFLLSACGAKRLNAGFLAAGMIVMQLFIGTTAMASGIVAAIPTSTPTLPPSETPTITLTFTQTFTSTITYTPTITNTPTITGTATATLVPPTNTPLPTNTYQPVIVAPVPVVEENYSNSGGGDDSSTETRYCCKICTKGKACGDTCINRNYTCHKGPGCACDG